MTDNNNDDLFTAVLWLLLAVAVVVNLCVLGGYYK